MAIFQGYMIYYTRSMWLLGSTRFISCFLVALASFCFTKHGALNASTSLSMVHCLFYHYHIFIVVLYNKHISLAVDKHKTGGYVVLSRSATGLPAFILRANLQDLFAEIISFY